MSASPDIKHLTAQSVKWNLIDRVASIFLYTIIGIILARQLDSTAFGLVGTVLMFQAFAVLFVDSGFSYALLQRKSPSRLDYSTILWFNIGISILVYGALWLCAPLIVSYYDNPQLLWISRITFLSFIFNAASIVQTNRLMKQKNVAPIAIANTLGLICAGVTAIYLAYALPPEKRVWAVVWQTNILNLTRCIYLWVYSRWFPLWKFSIASLKSFTKVGGAVLSTSFLNIAFQNVYTFVIGSASGMSRLGYYTQGEKWSKMGIASIAQVLTSSFIPTLSDFQDDRLRFKGACSKMNRAGSYIILPVMGGGIVIAESMFHVLFGTKWDPSILLFQILMLRGVFTCLISLYNNYAIALGHARIILRLEIIRDVTAAIALAATLPFINLSKAGDTLYGIQLLLWGQVAASVVAWIATLYTVAPMTGNSRWSFITDTLPYAVITVIMMVAVEALTMIISSPLPLLILQLVTGIVVYYIINAVTGSKIQRDTINFILKRNSRIHKH